MASQDVPLLDLVSKPHSLPPTEAPAPAPPAQDPTPVPKSVSWEDFQDALARLCGVASVHTKLAAKREALAQKLEASIEVRKESLQRIHELEAMKNNLRLRELRLENAKTTLRERVEEVVCTRGKLLPSARSLIDAQRALAAAQIRLQEAEKLLGGEGGHGRLLHLKNMLAARQQLMVNHVTTLYPLAPSSTVVSASAQQDHSNNTMSLSSASSDHFGKGQESSSLAAVDKLDKLPMTIGGLQVLAPLNKKPGLYLEKNAYEASATALGYVAHVVSLVASYLDVPLRYPLRLGASRSYIQDYARVVEAGANETIMNAVGAAYGGAQRTIAEYPLFCEGQDLTRSAYAVFLLNKDLEQMLNYLGTESFGPRHTLPNLHKLAQLVCSGAHVAL